MVSNEPNVVRIAVGGRWCENNCRHCGLPTADYPPFNPEETLGEIRQAVEYAETISWYVNGSYSQQPWNFKQLAIDLLATSQCLKRLQIESRADLVTEDWLAPIKQGLPKIKVEVGLGLDTDDFEQQRILGRNDNNVNYMNAVRLIQGYGFVPVTFVAIGSPFGTEEENFESAAMTAFFALYGGSHVSFEPLGKVQ